MSSGTVPKRVLILLSDTGGGHRASARAIEAGFHLLYGDDCPEIRIFDIWTDYGSWPFNSFVFLYRYATENPWCWKLLYEGSQSLVSRSLFLSSGYAVCGANFRKAITRYQPDLIISVHPLCQHVPLQILKEIKDKPGTTTEGSCGETTNGVPLFVTIVTDLGGCHPTWFHPKVTKCYVPSDPVRQIALHEGMLPEQLKQIGLPIGPEFWRSAGLTRKQARARLGLMEMKTCLLMGGGEGVGRLDQIARSIAASFFTGIDITGSRARGCHHASEEPHVVRPGARLQLVVVCGKNKSVKEEIYRELLEIQKIVGDHLMKVTTTGDQPSVNTPPTTMSENKDAECTKSIPYDSDKARRMTELITESHGIPFPSKRKQSPSSDKHSGSGGSNNHPTPHNRISRSNSVSPAGRRRTGSFSEILSSLKREVHSIVDLHSTIIHQRDGCVPSESYAGSNDRSASRHRTMSSFDSAVSISVDALSPQSDFASDRTSDLVQQSMFIDPLAKEPQTPENNNTTSVSFHCVIYQFVNFMQLLMSASDMIVTKAGPGTIAEAAITGLPILLSSYLPGQEEGNVSFVLDHMIGGYCVEPSKIAIVVREWMTNPEYSIKLKNMSVRCRNAMDPKATLQIVTDLGELLGLSSMFDINDILSSPNHM